VCSSKNLEVYIICVIGSDCHGVKAARVFLLWPLTVHVADQSIELVGDLGQVGFNAVLILFAADAELIEILEDLGLPLFDVL
jgi:hypothetical protein